MESSRLPDKTKWILDSGCTQHMTYDEPEEMKESKITEVKMGNEATLPVLGKGDVVLEVDQEELPLKDVLVVPELNNNLMSVSGLLDSGYDVYFQCNPMICKIQKNDKPIAKAVRRNNLWYLETRAAKCNLTKGIDENKLWHLRLNHWDKGAMFEKQKDISGLPILKTHLHEPCIGCSLGKQTKLSYPKAAAPRNTSLLELIHTDVIGPISTEAMGHPGKRFLLTLIDDFSRKVWIFFLHSKGEVPSSIKEWTTMVETQTGRKVKRIRSDNGGEYINNYLSNLFSEKEMIQELTIPYSP